MTDPSPTHRWRGVLAVTLVAGGLALVAKRPALLLSAVVGVVFVAYARVAPPPSPAVELDRQLDEASPSHGGRVDVHTTVRNVGDRTLFDLRIVDGVPPALAVVEGTPRHGTVLRPGEATTFSYAVAARRGRHRFEPATVVARDVSGSWEAEVGVDDATTVDCTTDVPAAPLRGRTLEAVGRVLADDSGAGTEFHQTRAYRRGDALSRVDWNRYASTGDLTTIEFRKEQATRVILVVDARPVAYRAPGEEPHAVAYAVAAAEQLARAIVDNRNHVGLAAFGREPCWLEPGTGRNHALRVQQRLADHAAFSARPPDDAPPVADQAKPLRARLENGDQLLVISPLLDDDVVETVRRFEAEETPVSVLSPDVTDADGGGGRTLARIERDHRHRALRRAGVRVVDWDPARPLSVAVTDAMEDQQ